MDGCTTGGVKMSKKNFNSMYCFNRNSFTETLVLLDLHICMNNVNIHITFSLGGHPQVCDVTNVHEKRWRHYGRLVWEDYRLGERRSRRLRHQPSSIRVHETRAHGECELNIHFCIDIWVRGEGYWEVTDTQVEILAVSGASSISFG